MNKTNTILASGIAIALCEIFMPATAIGQNTQQSDSTKVKTEKMAMYPNLSMKGIFPMPTWFGYTSNWEAIGLQEAVAFSGNKNTGAFAVQVNRQMPCGFSVDLIFNQPIDGTGMANLWLAKKFFGDKLALGGAFSTAKPVSQAGWTIQANPIYTDKTLLTFGVQTNNIGGEATTKGAVEARREVGGGRIIGFGGYTVLTGEMMTEFGGSVGGALKDGKGARINVGIGAKKNGNEFAINGITLGLQIPTKKCGIPFDTRMAYDPKGKTINASLYWTLPQGNGKPKANATRMLPQKIIR